LWLVKEGHVTPYEDDLEAYRKLLLASDKPSKPAAPAAAPRKRPSRDAVQALRSEVRKCEARVEKLNEMRDKLAKKLADPAMYEPEKLNEAQVWQKKYAEVMEGLDRAESLWLSAIEKLETVDG
ncbi:MAG: ABC transporter ATP-binding protein, partial [Paracoccaceae bacterium]